MSARICIAAAALLAVIFGPAVPTMDARIANIPFAPRATEGCDAAAQRAKLDFKLKDVSGAGVKLSDFKGKVIVLNFWATWCAPCKTEIPDFVELQERHGAAGLQMFGISADDTVKQLQPFVAALKINYPVLQARGSTAILDAYAVASLPMTVLIGRDGTLCKRYAGPVAKDVLEGHIKPLL